MAAITVCSDFGAQKNKVWHCFHCFPIYFPWSDGTRCHDFSFWMLSSGGQNIGVSASKSVLPMNTQDWSPLGWIGWSPCSPRDSQESSPTPQFININSLALSLLHIPTLTSIHDHRVSQEADLVFPSLSEFSTVYCDPHSQIFGIVNKAEIDVFLEVSCFFNDPMDFGNLISGSFVFSKLILNIWKFMVHVLLKPGLENFEHYFASVWDECNCVVVWAFFGITFLWDWNENWAFPVLWPLLSFPNLLAYWVQHFHSIIF